MMSTDDERREVARRMRETGEELGSAALLWYHIAKALGVHTATDGKTACGMLADLVEPEPERTCKVVRMSDFGGAVGEHSIWYECGARLLVADGTPDPVYCPGCGGRIE